LVVVALVCAKPELFKDLIGFWIGYSEHYDPEKPIESPGTVKWLPADHDKRDAVVDAFKHAWHAYGSFNLLD
jgi:mannosyl-oligosaccharide alpha-1,2-mannosidase